MTHRSIARITALAATAATAFLLLQSPAASAQEKHLQFSINLGHHGYYLPPPPPPVVVHHDYHVEYYPAPAIHSGYSNYGSFGYSQPNYGNGHYHGHQYCRTDHGRGKHKIKYKHRDRHHDRDHDDD